MLQKSRRQEFDTNLLKIHYMNKLQTGELKTYQYEEVDQGLIGYFVTTAFIDLARLMLSKKLFIHSDEIEFVIIKHIVAKESLTESSAGHHVIESTTLYM